jgi:predicted nucleic acid-binding protein
MKLYLDTSVPYLLFADEAPYRRVVTEMFLDWLKHSSDQIFVSSLVEEEISQASTQRCAALIAQLQKLPITMLRMPRESVQLADHYIAEGIVPRKLKCDILHVAIAVCYGLDVVISWSGSITNMYRVMRICEFNSRNGLPLVVVHTPEVAFRP